MAAAKKAAPLTTEQAEDFCAWLGLTLGPKVKTVKVSAPNLYMLAPLSIHRSAQPHINDGMTLAYIYVVAYILTATHFYANNLQITNRLSDSPAIVTDHESGALRRMMKMVVRTQIHHFFVLQYM